MGISLFGFSSAGAEERGGDMMSGALLSLGAALVSITVAQAAPLSVGALLSNPDSFRDQPVTVRGALSQYRTDAQPTRTHYCPVDDDDGSTHNSTTPQHAL